MKMPAELIREEIHRHRVIPFAQFMELALYSPETGYYEANRDRVGCAGDFITSVSTGSLFGELLAFQFAEWLEAETRSQKSALKIVEAGAHDGKLARDILGWLGKCRPELFAGMEYWILEPSPTRQQWQQKTLENFSNIRWCAGFDDLKRKNKSSKLAGVFFSNELLDAFPLRRLGWDAKAKNWFEWGVALDGDKYIWAKIQNPGFQIQNLCPAELARILPDNYSIELSPGAENWWRTAAGILTQGKLIAIDYGYTAEEQFSPSRPDGTLRAYYRHQVSGDLLANPGEQDLTAHVNFSRIQNAGTEAGLKTDCFCSQPQFLTRILSAAVKGKGFPGLDAKQVRQFQTLTHPEHLGRAFRVLIQSR